MEAPIPWGSLIILAICVLAVAFFSSSEASLTSLSRLRIHRLASQGDQAAQATQHLAAARDKLFAVYSSRRICHHPRP